MRAAFIIPVLAVTLGACSNGRMLPIVYMPDPPKECEQVLGFKVEPLPAGKSNAAKLAVDMAKEGAARQNEHTVSKVCAEYALRTAGTMKDKDIKAASDAPKVDAATTVPPTTTKTSSTRKRPSSNEPNKRDEDTNVGS